ncbi:restriction endonuclease [Sesbania bispinosa]|nr:restriction endonuclease [Sesbania bispinosa]
MASEMVKTKILWGHKSIPFMKTIVVSPSITPLSQVSVTRSLKKTQTLATHLSSLPQVNNFVATSSGVVHSGNRQKQDEKERERGGGRECQR